MPAAKIGLGGFIRGMHEARAALAEVLALGERRLQIILIMQKIVICMSRDTRKFLSDSMAGLIEGGLDYMRQKRREAIQQLQKKAAPVVAAPVIAAPQPAPAQKVMGSDAIRERMQKEMNRKREDEQRRLEEEQRRAREEQERLQREEQERLARELADAARAAEEAAEAEIPDYELPSPEDFAAEPKPPEPKPEPITEEAPPVVEAPAVVETPAYVPDAPPEPQFSSEVPPTFDDAPLPPEEAELKAIEEIGSELDALSLADVAREIFPDLKKDYEPWQIARTIFIDESSMRKAVLQGARLKDNERATMLAPALDDVKRLIEKHKPSWMRSIPAIREVIDAHFAAVPPRPDRSTPAQVQDVIVMADQKAKDLLVLIKKSNEPGIPFVAKVRERLDRLLDIEAERT